MEAAFANHQQDFVHKLKGEGNLSELEGTHPTGHFDFLEFVEDVGKLLGLLVGVVFGFAALVLVEFLVVVVDDFVRNGSKQRIAFTGGVLAATFLGYVLGDFEGRCLVGFCRAFGHTLLEAFVANECGDGYDEHEDDESGN